MTANMIQLNGSPPMPNFTFDDSLQPYNMPMQTWLLANNRQDQLNGLATANVVFSNTTGKVLLVQRAAHDSMPNRWEVPGGAVDNEDLTILHAAARELWEEAGLFATRFTHMVAEKSGLDPGFVFSNAKRTSTWCRFTFAVEVVTCDTVKLEPNEHQDFLWASEEEVRNEKVGEREVPITTPNVVAMLLEAFRLRRERANA